MTTVSILLPHYNDPAGLALTLRSVEAQTWKGSREVVVVDDGSRDEHKDRLRQVCAESSENVRLIENARNRGRPYTRNVLLDAAEGKLTTWLDAGDEIYPRKLELQIEGLYRARFLEFEQAVWCTCNYDMHWVGTRRRKAQQRVDDDPLGALLQSTLRAYLWTLLGTTQSFRDVGYFDLALPRLQDLDFFLRFVEKGGMFVMPPTDDPLCVYHKSDVGKNGQMVLECFEHIYAKHAPALMARSRRYRRNREYDVYMLAARFTQNNGELGKMLGYLGLAAARSPVRFARKMARDRGRL